MVNSLKALGVTSGRTHSSRGTRVLRRRRVAQRHEGHGPARTRAVAHGGVAQPGQNRPDVLLLQEWDIRGLGQARCPTNRSRGCPRRVNRDIFVSKVGERDIPRLPFPPRTFPLPTSPSHARTPIGRSCRVKNTRVCIAVYTQPLVPCNACITLKMRVR